MAGILRLPIERIGADAAMGSLPHWDSTAHMRMVLALEDEFGIVLDETQMVEMTSFAKVCGTVEALQTAKSR